MPDDVQIWITGGTLALALLVFGVGFFREWRRRSLTPTLLIPDEGDEVRLSPPPLEQPTGRLPWRVPSGIYNRFDLPLVAFVIGIYSMPLMSDFFPAPEKQDPELSAAGLVVSMVVQLFLASMVVGFVIWRMRPAEWLGLRWERWPLVLAIAPAAVFLTWGVSYSLYFSGYTAWLQDRLGGDGLQEAVKAFNETESIGTLVLLVLAAAVVAPMTEEVLFRGYLYPVAKRFIGRVPAVAFNALIFGVAHHNAMAMIPLVFLAVLLVLAYEWTGSIWAPIGIHFLFNGSTVAIQLMVRAGIIPGAEGVAG